MLSSRRFLMSAIFSITITYFVHIWGTMSHMPFCSQSTLSLEWSCHLCYHSWHSYQERIFRSSAILSASFLFPGNDVINVQMFISTIWHDRGTYLVHNWQTGYWPAVWWCISFTWVLGYRHCPSFGHPSRYRFSVQNSVQLHHISAMERGKIFNPKDLHTITFSWWQFPEYWS